MLKNSLRMPGVYIPTSCTLCAAEVHHSIALCKGCKADLPWIASGCRSCGFPLPSGTHQLICGECLTEGTPFTLAITPLLYQKPIDRLITSFKHRRGFMQGHLLAQLLLDAIRDHYIDDDGIEIRLPDVIIPVPLHWQRFLWRGYNQSAELGKHLGKELNIPCRHDLIKRLRRTPSQQGLSREQRLHNLRDAFQIKQIIPFKRVALLDDVITTGATTHEIARLLLKHGAEEIHVWAIARTPR